MPLVFGEVDAVLKQDPAVLFGPDDFTRGGSAGWEGLLNGTTPAGVVLRAPRHVISNGAVLLGMEDGGTSINPDTYAMAVKRLSLPTGATYLLFDVWLAIQAYHATNGVWLAPRTIDIGLDTGWGTAADGSANRSFYAVRYLIFDEGATGPNQRWQVKQGSGGSVTYADFPGQPTFPLGYNENKANMFHVKMLANVSSRTVSGFWVNGQGYGRLASTPDGTLEALGAAYTSSLVQGGAASFYGGLNACLEVYSRNSVPLSKSKLYFSRPMVSVA